LSSDVNSAITVILEKQSNSARDMIFGWTLLLQNSRNSAGFR